MHHFLIQMETEQRASEDNPLNQYFRSLPGARTLAHGFHQWFELIDTDEEQWAVLVAVANRLSEGDRIGVWEIPDTELPLGETDEAKAWLKAREPLGTLITIPSGIPTRKWTETPQGLS